MKLGIVFEGGALRTTFSCGVMDALLELNIMADYIIGVSAGASYAVSYASGQIGRNYDIITHYTLDKKYMGLNNLLNPKNRSYFGLDYVYDTIPNKLVPLDYKAFEQYPGEFYAVVTNVETGKAEYLPVDRKDHTHRILRATCALPLMFPIININGKPYMDGGISDSIPYEKALADGCDKLIVVLTRERGYLKSTDSTVKIATRKYRKYPDFCKAMLDRADNYNASLNHLFELEKEGKVYVITPTSTKGFSRVEKDLNKIEALYKDGIDITKAQCGAIKHYIHANHH